MGRSSSRKLGYGHQRIYCLWAALMRALRMELVGHRDLLKRGWCGTFQLSMIPSESIGPSPWPWYASLLLGHGPWRCRSTQL